MQHPAFQNLPRIILYSGSCLLIGLAVVVSQSGLVPVSIGILTLDGLFSALAFGVISILLWYVIRFSSLTGNDNIQKLVNYSALVILVNLIWLGLDYLFMYICVSEASFSALTKSLPMKIILGILIFTMAIRFLIGYSTKEDTAEEEEMDAQKKPDSHKLGVEEVYANPVPKVGWLQKITVKVGQKIHVIAVTDILFLEAEGDYVKIITASNHYIKEQTMKYFEENLLNSKFIRIHRSFIVNIDAISRIELYEKQYYRITLHSGHQLKASASGYRLLKNILQL